MERDSRCDDKRKRMEFVQNCGYELKNAGNYQKLKMQGTNRFFPKVSGRQAARLML